MAPEGICSAAPSPGAQWLVATEDGASDDGHQVQYLMLICVSL